MKKYDLARKFIEQTGRGVEEQNVSRRCHQLVTTKTQFWGAELPSWLVTI